MDKLYGHVLGAALVNPIVEFVDVDGVVRRIDIDNLVSRIDIDELVSRIDLNTQLQRIDWNTQLQRIDWNAVLRTIDINQVILRRSDMGALLAQSTTGIFTTMLDYVRVHIVQVDLALNYMIQWHCLRGDTVRTGVLPPKPGPSCSTTSQQRRQRQRHHHEPLPSGGRYAQAIAVQGRYTGIFSKAVAMFVDVGFLTITFAVGCIIIKLCWILFLHETKENATKRVDRNNWNIYVLYCIYWFLHFFLSVLITGSTVGMSVAGITVVDSKKGLPSSSSSSEDEISFGQAFLRTLWLPLTATFFPPLAVFGILRRDGRMLHDVIADTGLVYCWDAQFAWMRKQAAIQLRQRQMDAYNNMMVTASSSQPQQTTSRANSNSNSNSDDYNNDDDHGNATDPLLQSSQINDGASNEPIQEPTQNITYSTFSDP